MSPRLNAIIGPIVTSIAPILLLAGANIGDIEFQELVLPLIASLVLVAVFAVAWSILLRQYDSASVLTSVSTFLFMMHGHVYNAVMVDRPWSNYGHTLLFSLWLVVLVALATMARVRPQAMIRISRAIATFGSILAAIALVPFLTSYWSHLSIAASLKNNDESGNATQAKISSSEPGELPDIYYIVLDGYGRADQLAECYGHDNTEFIEFLESNDFYVAKQSHTNYAHTFLSLASSLNMRLVNREAEEVRQYASDKRNVFYDLIRTQKVGQFLQSKGYRYVHFNTWWGGTQRSDIADMSVGLSANANGIFGRLTEFHRVFIGTTALSPILTGMDVDKSGPFQISAEHFRYCFEKLKEIPDLKGPTYTFAHIISPHPPYYFDAEGNSLEADPRDRDWTKHDAYVAQLTFVNKQMEEIVSTIRRRSQTEPIILIQADHGTASLHAETDRPAFISERMAILNAYYMPQSIRRRLYPTITPVNSFRVLFSELFDEQLPPLPDQCFFSWYPANLDLTEVTDQLKADSPR